MDGAYSFVARRSGTARVGHQRVERLCVAAIALGRKVGDEGQPSAALDVGVPEFGARLALHADDRDLALRDAEVHHLGEHRFAAGHAEQRRFDQQEEPRERMMNGRMAAANGCGASTTASVPAATLLDEDSTLSGLSVKPA